MDISTLKDWMTVIGSALAVILSLYAILTKPAKESSDRLETFEKEVDEKLHKLAGEDIGHDQRIQRLENEMQHLPDKDMVHRMELSMKDMQVQMATMASETQATSRSLRRMEEWLIKKGTEAQ